MRAWAVVCRLAKLSDLHVHNLRHTFGTLAIENGATLPEIKEVMGHKSITSTEGYVHATEAGKNRAVEAVLRKPGHITVTREEIEKRLKIVDG
ncbi:MAG: tyrosine-type recombinase/integrase [Acidobacteriota bacterium]